MFSGCQTSKNCTISSKNKNSNILKHKKETAVTIINFYRQTIDLSNDFIPSLFFGLDYDFDSGLVTSISRIVTFLIKTAWIDSCF